jgi:hypothetical protein
VETASRKEALTVLRRLINYGEKIFSLSATLLAPLGDRRVDPRRSTPAVVKAVLVLFWTRLPSLNALAQIPAPRFWKQWLRESLASADTPGRVPAGLYADHLRQSIFLVYQQLKRNTVRRQLDAKPELLSSEWIWVTTAPAALVPTERTTIFGHQS